MNDKEEMWHSNYSSWSTNKSDMRLIEVLKGDDPEERNVAEEILHKKYHSRIKSYATTIVGEDNADDVAAKSIEKVFKYIEINKAKVTNFDGLLMTITRRTCIDVLRGLGHEKKFENNIPLTEYLGEATVKAARDPMEAIIAQEIQQEKQKELQVCLQYAFREIPGCPRVVWILRHLYGYNSSVVARLLEKSEQTVYSHFHAANKQMDEYHQSEDYKLDLEHASQRREGVLYDTPTQWPHFVVERFTKPITTQFTPDELKPLGLTVKQSQNYVTSLILPGPRQQGLLLETRLLYLLLTRRSELVRMQKMFNHLSRLQDGTGNLHNLDLLANKWDTRLTEFLIAVNVNDDGSIVLIPQSATEFYIEAYYSRTNQVIIEAWGGNPPPNAHFSLHSRRVTIPVFTETRKWWANYPVYLEREYPSEVFFDQGVPREWLQEEDSLSGRLIHRYLGENSTALNDFMQKHEYRRDPLPLIVARWRFWGWVV